MDSNYWDDIYKKKTEEQVSWYQDHPEKSLELIREFNLAFTDKIIDIGGGDSKLVDHLLGLGFKDITVLDISSKALEKTELRLKGKENNVKFITSDVTKFNPTEKYKLWHDRATFHFLTKLEDVEKYLQITSQAIDQNGFLIVSTFSKTGPEKCSGLSICQYSEDDLKALFGKYFSNIRCFEDTHQTPWNSTQNFVYCGFKKINQQYPTNKVKLLPTSFIFLLLEFAKTSFNMIKEMFKFFVSISILVVLFLSIGQVESCSINECTSSQQIDMCLLCNMCGKIDLTTALSKIKPKFEIEASLIFYPEINLSEKSLPKILFRPPIS